MGMTEEETRRVFDRAQKISCDHEAYEFGDWSPMGGSCSCADPNAPAVIAGLLAVAAAAERRGREAAVATVREVWQRETASRMSATMPMWLRAALDAAGGAR